MTIGGEAIQHQRHQLRLLRRAVALLLCIAVVIAALGVAAIRRDADALLHQDVWSELFLWGAVLVLVVVALVGTYSVMADFLFWEGWLNGLPDPSHLFAAPSADDRGHRHYLVYLDGIHQSEECHPPRVSEFLDTLEQAIEADALLVKGIEAYTIMPVGLRATAYARWFWERLFALQEHHPNGLVRFLCAFCVQANNVIKDL